jgi:pimeloyl-ACP methyl ester carboxylesterase
MRARSEGRLRLSWNELNVPRAARAMTVPLLIAHDEEDEKVAWREGAEIAAVWPGARLITTRGLGHGGVVRAPEVRRDVIRLFDRVRAAASLAGRIGPARVRAVLSRATLGSRDLTSSSRLVEGDSILVACQPLV